MRKNDLTGQASGTPAEPRVRGGTRLDLTGQRFGRLIVLEPAADVGRYTAWRCRCDCGNETVVRTGSLRQGRTRSCGCHYRWPDLTGQRFGRLTVLERAANIGKDAAWRCRCDCGNETVVRTGSLRSGHTKSCGCLQRGLDLTGQRYGLLTVLEKVIGAGGVVSWRCRCDCGNETVVLTGNLRQGRTRSCGCLPRGLDLTGQRFGRLTALERVIGTGGVVSWRCRCDCGNETVVRTASLRSGVTRSCGCLQRDMRKGRGRADSAEV